MALPVVLDRFDRAILHALQLDGRAANSALAQQVNLSESACLRRIRALEESGLIESYTAVLNQQKAGFPVNVFVNITLDSPTGGASLGPTTARQTRSTVAPWSSTTTSKGCLRDMWLLTVRDVW